MRMSEQINEIATALAAAQGEIDPAPKDSVNPHFKSRYADLASCWQAARPALAKYGLAVAQFPAVQIDSGAMGMVTRLMHKSGQWIENELWCKPRGLGPQEVGAAATYLRRYGFSSLVGVVADEDDDGNKAQASDRDDPGPRMLPPQQQRRQAAPQQAAPRAPANQPDPIDPAQPYDHGDQKHRRHLGERVKFVLNADELDARMVEMIRCCGRALSKEGVPIGSLDDSIREWGRLTQWGQVDIDEAQNGEAP